MSKLFQRTVLGKVLIDVFVDLTHRAVHRRIRHRIVGFITEGQINRDNIQENGVGLHNTVCIGGGKYQIGAKPCEKGKKLLQNVGILHV